MKCLPVLVLLRLHIRRVVASVSAVGKQLLGRIAADHLPLASIAHVLPLSSFLSCCSNYVLFVLALGIKLPVSLLVRTCPPRAPETSNGLGVQHDI